MIASSMSTSRPLRASGSSSRSNVVDDREYRASPAIADITALYRGDELRIALEAGEIRVQLVHPLAGGVAPGYAAVLGAGHPVPEAQGIAVHIEQPDPRQQRGNIERVEVLASWQLAVARRDRAPIIV